MEDAAKEAEAFLKKRDEFFGQDNTTWDRALQLINQDDADIIGVETGLSLKKFF